MVRKRPPDPVDLMLEGRFEAAADAYAELYADAQAKGNLAIGPDLMMGFQYCIAAIARQPPSDAKITPVVAAELQRRGIRVDDEVREHVEIANDMITMAKRRSEASVARVEREKKGADGGNERG
jgi:hypothetical protein